MGTALTASSLATLKPLFRQFGAVFTTTARGQSSFWQSGGGRASARRSAGAVGAPGQLQSRRFSAYAPRKGSLSVGAEALPVSLPVQARWHYTNYSNGIEIVPGSPASDALSSGSRKAIYFKRWEEDMV